MFFIRHMNSWMRNLFIGVIIAFSGQSILAQGGNVRDTTIFTPLVSLNFAGYLPAGDLVDRFGINASIGASANFKSKTNWLYGFEYGFHFSNQVEQDNILDGLKTDEGFILNSSGAPAVVSLFHRGHSFNVNFGRLFPVFGPNPNSGIAIRLGVGYWQHKIRIETNQENIPQLNAEMKKGYDRLSSGLLLHQFLGYYYLSNSKLVNFFAGFDFNQGLMSSRRTYAIDEMRDISDDKRFDIQMGIRVGWIAPIYKRSPNEFYRY